MDEDETVQRWLRMRQLCDGEERAMKEEGRWVEGRSREGRNVNISGDSKEEAVNILVSDWELIQTNRGE